MTDERCPECGAWYGAWRGATWHNEDCPNFDKPDPLPPPVPEEQP